MRKIAILVLHVSFFCRYLIMPDYHLDLWAWHGFSLRYLQNNNKLIEVLQQQQYKSFDFPVTLLQTKKVSL